MDGDEENALVLPIEQVRIAKQVQVIFDFDLDLLNSRSISTGPILMSKKQHFTQLREVYSELFNPQPNPLEEAAHSAAAIISQSNKEAKTL